MSRFAPVAGRLFICRVRAIIARPLDKISFSATNKIIDAAYVNEHVSEMAKDTDLSKFIL